MRKVTSLFVSIFLIAATSLTVFAYSDSFFSNGDVNLDGKLSISDGTEIQKELSDIITFNDQQLKLADFNLDGKVNIMDVTKIQKVLAGLEKIPTESTLPTIPEKEYVTPEEFGMVSDKNDDARIFQKVLDAAAEKGVPLNLEGKTYHIYTSEARCQITNGSLKIMPGSSLVLTGDNVSLKNVNISRWWKGDCYWNGDVRLHLTNGCVIEDCNFSSDASSPSIFCNTSANDTTIKNCTFSEGFGILFDDGNAGNRKYNDVLYTETIGKGLIVDNCTFNTDGKPVQYEGDNVEVNTPNCRFSDVQVTNCVSYGAKIGDNVGMGFGFAQVDNLVCSDNILSNIEGSGAIHMEACTDVESKNNVVRNSQYGIMCIYTNNALYDNNTIENCEYGIQCMAKSPYGYDEKIRFFNNNILNCTLRPLWGSGLKDSEIINNVFQTDCNYTSAIIELSYDKLYETKNVTISGNTIDYNGSFPDKNWAYIIGTDCNLYDNKIVGLSTSNFVNSNNPVIKIKLNLPSNTPMEDTLYLASNLNGWNPADSCYSFTRTSETTAEIIFDIPKDFDDNIEYKITRGSWKSGECNANGSEYVGEHGALNRTIDIIYGSGYYKIDIINWEDLYKQ